MERNKSLYINTIFIAIFSQRVVIKRLAILFAHSSELYKYTLQCNMYGIITDINLYITEYIRTFAETKIRS